MPSIMAWQETWAGSQLFGFKPMVGCEDEYWQVGLEVEYALLHSEHICGLPVLGHG